MEAEPGHPAAGDAHDGSLDPEQERNDPVGVMRQSSLDAADPRTSILGRILGDEIGTGTEVRSSAAEDDHPYRLVLVGLDQNADHGVEHLGVDGVALVRPVELDREDAVVQLDFQPLRASVGRHWSAKPWATASSAPWRSVAPPGGSGSRTRPYLRLGSRTVACPGAVVSPRWFSHQISRSTAGRSPSARYFFSTRPLTHWVSPT